MPVQRKYLQMFLEEGGALLSELDRQIVALEQGAAGPDALQDALRVAHTLKGGAKMVGLENVSRAAHAVETALKSAEAASGPVAPADLSAVLAVLDRVRAALALLAEGRDEEAASLDLSAATSRPSTAPDAAPPSKAGMAEADRPAGAGRVRVNVEKLDVLQNLVDDLSLQALRIQDHMGVFRQAFRGLERMAWDEEDRDFTAAERDAVRRVLRLLGGRGFNAYLEDLHGLDQVVAELQGQVFELRMVPLAEVLDEFHRAVRDLARELGKEVTLGIDGRFTELDKRLLEAIQAPLMHLVRNAVDHGIEAPRERRGAGKPVRGQVTIRAYHKGNAVVIEVEDDGRGLDAEMIRRRAVERGFLGAEEAASLPADEVRYLLCEPGFTTRDAVSEVSGRGVGLDVVKVQVEKLKGSLVVQSEPGRFSRFRMYLPLSISSLSAVVVGAGGDRYALPALFVDRCVKVDAAALAARDGSWVHEGRVLPVVSLARTLGAERPPVTGRTGLVVLQFRSRTMVLQVDRLEAEREIVLKPLGGHLRDVPFVLGASFLGDGPPVPVLNVVDLHARWPSLEASCRFEAGTAGSPRRVLVVDDSVTTRHMEQNVLEALGFQVLLAADGLEAWELLGRERVDLVLTDIEMPRLGGLDLCRRIRATPATAGLPVVAVSHRVDAEDLEAGTRAGLDAYLRKDRFSRRALAATLDGLLRGTGSGRAPG